MTDAVLVLNVGSSTLKFSVFPALAKVTGNDWLVRGKIEKIGPDASMTVTQAGCATSDVRLEHVTSHPQALAFLLAWIREHLTHCNIVMAGHRVVHGGLRYTAPVKVDAAILGALRELIPLAPLHQPSCLAGIEALFAMDPDLTQVACFDTAFHHTLPLPEATFALPRKFTEQGVRRYGFHGLSYEYIASVLPDYLGPAAEGRVIVAHLGSGASMCAMLNRQSIATTMSFTPLDGLPMGTRCGSIDPGAILYLVEQKGLSPDAVNKMLYHDSGLLGISGISDDMRTLLASKQGSAGEAVDFFVYHVARELGSLAAALGGVDAIVFTGGIGEHAAEIRRRVLAGAVWLGVKTADDTGPRLTTSDSPVSAWVIPTNEELVIARASIEIAGASDGSVVG
ncbi:MAG: acetate/propionate family kinase [Bradyrhizobiaceae bacterium]|nr:MAG: acetate/propionate family kinase [Bradyrhizobiaceae bacterium]